MAKTSKARRPNAPATPTGPRRLGADQNAPRQSAGAQRRAARRTTSRSSRLGWVAIGLVIVIVAVFVIVKTTSHSPSANASTGDSAGRHPAAASAALVADLTTIPSSVYESVGTGNQPVPFTVTAKQTPLTTSGLPSFVYEGAEYCPYCALMRWSLVAALARFGTFTGLKVTSSSNTDYNIPTLSFLGSHYTSKYLNFSAYEFEDRNQQPLQNLPSDAAKLESTYGFPPFASSSAQSGIPFLDIGNKYVTSGDPSFFIPLIPFLQNGGPGLSAIGQAIHTPTSTVGQAIQAKAFIIEANFITAAICNIDGGQPASVCTSPVIAQTIKSLNAQKTVS